METSSFIMLVAAIPICLWSCSQGQKKVDDGEDNNHHVGEVADSSLTYYDFVGHPNSEFNYYNEFIFSIDDIIHVLNPIEPENIKSYINSIIIAGEFIISRHDKENTIIAIRDLANQLQSYKDGKQGYFPDKELKKTLTNLLSDIAYVDNHGPGIVPRDFIIFPRLLEIAARLCPDISKMATHTSLDKNVGVITIDSQYNSNYDFTAIIVKTEDAYRIQYLPRCSDKINKIRYLNTSEHSSQYLLSYEDTNLYPPIYLINLYPEGNVDIHDLSANFSFAEWNDFIYNDKEADKHQVYFNPKEISWSWCKKNNYGNLEKIEGSKTLYVNLESYDLRLE